MSNELTTTMNHPLAIMPVMDLALAKERRQALINFVQSIMVPGVDFGRIEGTDKDTLLKPGAEKLTTFFGLSPSFITMDKEIDWTGDNHGGESFFYFRYMCRLQRGDMLVGEGLGSCNSFEKKYRFRMADRVCPNCGESAIIKGKEEYGGGWLCFKKKGGCGSKWPDGHSDIEGQKVGKVKNDSPADLVNTIDKMAQKRALVAATLIAVNASEFFTQDVEDMDFGSVIEGEFIETTTTKKTTATKSNGKAKTNGERDWTAFIETVAEHIYYQSKNGRANSKHIVGAATLLGITADNVEQDFGGHIQWMLEYAKLRGAGVEQDKAVAQVLGLEPEEAIGQEAANETTG